MTTDNPVLMEPEDCDECGCPAGDYEEGDNKCGVWYCPECGAPQ